MFVCTLQPYVATGIHDQSAVEVRIQRAMSDCGLKPTVVFHNLSPGELYEKVNPYLESPKP